MCKIGHSSALYGKRIGALPYKTGNHSNAGKQKHFDSGRSASMSATTSKSKQPRTCSPSLSDVSLGSCH